MSDQLKNGPVPEDPYKTKPPQPDAHPGMAIGHYKLLQPLGKGGMGEVWMAEQREPVERYVALKIVKTDLHGDHVIARFEAERQALAMMDHPNIAKVLDAGTTAASRPYFVMELVKGISFTQYCDNEKLTLKERIELFIPVCNAVQHAHQKGVVHRDLKPSNVLIALYDGKPVPKVIDFGVAKATHQKLTEKSMFTVFGETVGTCGIHGPGASGAEQPRHRHAGGHLFAGRHALRTSDRHAAVHGRAVHGEAFAGDVTDHPRSRAAEAEHEDFVVARPYRRSPPNASWSRNGLARVCARAISIGS